MVADFVADELFGGRNFETLLNAVAPQYRNGFVKFISEIFAKLKEFFRNDSRLTEIERLEKEFIRAAKKAAKSSESGQQKTTTDEGSGVEYSIVEEKYAEYNKPITLKDVEILRSIGRKSINDFTQEDIEKTQKWAYKFYQRLGVKSPFFRRWFGDWRVYDKGTTKVVNTKGATRNPSIKNTDTGWDVIVSRQVSKETNSHRGSNEVNARKYLPYIEDITKNAVLLDTNISSKDNPLSATFHYLYAYTEVFGYPALLKLQVEELINEKDGSSIFRDYILQNIEEAPISLGQRFSKAHHHKNGASYVSISDLFAIVKKYDAEFNPRPVNKHLVSEDGTPKVFYHGTDSDFTEFDVEKKRTGGKLNFGRGIYLTPSKSLAGMYTNSGKVMELFAALEKPYEIFSTRLDNIDLLKLSNQFGETVDIDNVDTVLKKNGYDGIIARTYNGTTNLINQIVVFDNSKVKSATDNIGTFDKQSNIRYSLPDNPTALQIGDAYKNGEITPEQYEAEIARLNQGAVEVSGKIKQGEMVEPTNKPYDVPKSVSSKTKVRQYIRTVLETGYATSEMEAYLTELVLNGDFSYTPTTNKERIDKAVNNINSRGYQNALHTWEKSLGALGGIPPHLSTKGFALCLKNSVPHCFFLRQTFSGSSPEYIRNKKRTNLVVDSFFIWCGCS